MGNSIGKEFTVTSFGESHGKCVGAVVDGCPAGLRLSEEEIQKELDRRKPGQKLSTPRQESDKVEILSGVFNGFTTGAPLCMLTWNKDTDSSFYEKRKHLLRPGHADYTACVKYGGFNDYRGGGRFSARITAGFVMAGAIAKKLLSVMGTEVVAHSAEIGGVKSGKVSIDDMKNISNAAGCADASAAVKMEAEVRRAMAGKDSLGGVVECIAVGVPAGIGEPVFDNVESELSKALMAIPAAKGIEFGSGFEGSRKRGSENNDPFIIKNGKIVTKTNNAGGVLGGISSGMPVTIRVAFKPVASIPKAQKTVNVKTMKEEELSVLGRFDPCVVPRAVPIVESMTAIVLCDLALRAQMIQKVLK